MYMDCTKGTTLVGDADSRESYAWEIFVSSAKFSEAKTLLKTSLLKNKSRTFFVVAVQNLKNIHTFHPEILCS